MDRYAIVNDQGLVINVIIWDGIQEYLPKVGHALIYAPIGDIGDSYDFDNDIFIKPDRTATEVIHG